jgi:hypothetical protein
MIDKKQRKIMQVVVIITIATVIIGMIAPFMAIAEK